MRFEPIAIVGVGCVLPDAPDPAAFLDNLRRARYSIDEVDPRRWNPAEYFSPGREAGKTYSKIGAWVKDFEFAAARYRIPPNVLRHVDVVQQWAITACEQALADTLSCGARQRFDPQRCAVVMGNSMGGEYRRESEIWVDRVRYEKAAREAGICESQVRAFAARLVDGLVPLTEDTLPGELPNIVAGRVAQALDLHGPNYVIDAACASSLAAVMNACLLLQHEHVSWVIAGASDRSMDPCAFAKFSAVGALSAEGSYPFDARASGFVMGEGAGAVMLRRLDDALAGGDRVYAVIRGIGGSSDGRGKGIVAPNVKGQELALRRAYESAGYGPESVDLVEAHGTATPVGDPIEVIALARTFKARTQPVALGSVKSMLGHLKTAAGIVSLLKAALALHHREILPSANFSTPNARIPWTSTPFRVPTELDSWPVTNGRPPRASVSSFGFGGTNFHLTLEAFDQRFHRLAPPAPRQPAAGAAVAPLTPPAMSVAVSANVHGQVREVEGGVLCFAAETAEEAVRQALVRCRGWLARGPLFDTSPDGRRLSQVAAEQLREAPGEPVRLALAAGSWQQLRRQLELLERIDQTPSPDYLAASGIFLNAGPAPGKVAFLFPGQGSQYLGMLQDLGRRYRPIGELWRRADRALEDLLGEALSGIVSPSPLPTAERRAAAERRLIATEHCQPAILTSSLALLELCRRHRVEPDLVGGHSLGEYSALVAAGVLSFADALRAVVMRGTEMAQLEGDDHGLMASVAAGAEETAKILERSTGYAIVANKNSPRTSVIAGETAAVEEAVERCREGGIPCTLLPVSHAFHCRIVAPVEAPLKRFLNGLDFRPPRLPITTNVDGSFYPEAGAGKTRELFVERLGAQIHRPVEWTRQVRTMRRAGARIWVECGPKRVLTTFGRDILSAEADRHVMTNHPKPGGIATWLGALAQLWVAGLPATLPELDDPLHSDLFRVTPPVLDRATPEQGRRQGAEREVLKAVAELTGYPRRLLSPNLELDRDLGLDTATLATLHAHLGVAGEGGKIADLIAAHAAAGSPAPDSGRLQRPAPAPPAAETAEPVAVRAATTAVEARLVEVLSEKTGYPPEVLAVDADLEGDLGIDSVKQAEVLSSLYQQYGLELPAAEVMAEASTIEKAARALAAQLGDRPLPQPPAQGGAGATAETVAALRQEPEFRLWRATMEPFPPLPGPLDARRDGSRTVLVSDDHGGDDDLARAVAEELRRRGFAPLVVDPSSPLPAPAAQGSVAGVMHLLAPPGQTAEHREDAGSEAVLRAFELVKAARPELFAVSVTRVDGRHGHAGRRGASVPWNLGVHGVFKSLAWERPELRVRCYDLKPGLLAKTGARRLVDDLLDLDGPEEIGLDGRRRYRRIYRPHEGPSRRLEVSAEDVILVTGGGSGITARCALALARDLGGGRFALLGSTPLHPQAGALARLTEAEMAARKQSLIDELGRAGERPTPQRLERAWRPLERGRAVQRTLDAFAAAGARAIYLRCDVTDPQAVQSAVETCRRQLGPPSVVIHGAGLERSRTIADKDGAELTRVFAVKARGWQHLERATRRDPVRLFVSFSSVAGRFGNAGQSDYSAANAALGAAAEQLVSGGDCRHLALAWTAWAETGMATGMRERLEQAGVDTLPDQTGAELFIRALASDLRGEVLVAGSLGRLDRWHSLQAVRPHAEASLIDEVVELAAGRRLLARRRLQRWRDLFLEDHRIRGVPVLPGVMSLEAFAEAASLVHPGLLVEAFSEVEFPLPVKVDGSEDLELVAETLDAHPGETDAPPIRVDCRWLGGASGTRVPARGVCELRPERAGDLGRVEPVAPGRVVLSAEEIYRPLFHGPRFRCLGGVLRRTPDALESRIERRLQALFSDLVPRFAVAPLVLEAAIQNAGLLLLIRDRALALPTAIRRLRYAAPPPRRQLFTRARVGAGGNHDFDCQVVDREGRLYVSIEGLRFTVVEGGRIEVPELDV